jgi:hypothetical protein
MTTVSAQPACAGFDPSTLSRTQPARRRKPTALAARVGCLSAELPSAQAMPTSRRRLDDVHRGSAVSEFLERYRRAFAAFDAETIADMFAYPCQLTSDESEITVTTVSTREAWLPQVERLVAAYRAIGVHAAEILELQVTELTPELAQAVVHWALVDGAGERIYEFNAAYTLADLSRGLRITAIAHNETPRMRAAIGARQREEPRDQIV